MKLERIGIHSGASKSGVGEIVEITYWGKYALAGIVGGVKI